MRAILLLLFFCYRGLQYGSSFYLKTNFASRSIRKPSEQHLELQQTKLDSVLQPQNITNDTTVQKVDRIVRSFLTSNRERASADILKSITVTEGRLSSSILLNVMRSLVEKRDHARFGDLLTHYEVSKSDSVEKHSESKSVLTKNIWTMTCQNSVIQVDEINIYQNNINDAIGVEELCVIAEGLKQMENSFIGEALTNGALYRY